MTRRAYRERVLACLPATQAEIRDRTGLTLATVSRWIADIQAQDEAHIGGWFVYPHGGPVAAIWHPGPGETAPKPKLVTEVERTRAYRKRMRASGDWEDVKARRRAEYAARRPAARRDPLMALFGPAEAHGGVS